jgi:Cd2+/Zn2+-exporting ATPase
MGAAGTDVAPETADVALMGDDLGRLPFVVGLSRRTLATIRQNIGFSLAVKAAFLLLTVAGISSLWMAVLADTGTSVLVVLNSLRLLRGGDAGIAD